MSKEFEEHRRWFSDFKRKLKENEDVKSEFINAIDELIREYDTALYENRFVVGGAIEHIFVALVRSLGFSAQHLGTTEKRGDLKIGELEFSLKTSFTGRGEIRLINKLGRDVDISWGEPTIFIISGLGIIYADPDLLREKIIDKGDALTLDVEKIQNLASNSPEFFVKIQIPRKPTKIESRHTASFDVAVAILKKIGSKRLINYL